VESKRERLIAKAKRARARKARAERIRARARALDPDRALVERALKREAFHDPAMDMVESLPFLPPNEDPLRGLRRLAHAHEVLPWPGVGEDPTRPETRTTPPDSIPGLADALKAGLSIGVCVSDGQRRVQVWFQGDLISEARID